MSSLASLFFPQPNHGTTASDLADLRAALPRAAGWVFRAMHAEGEPSFITVDGPGSLQALVGREYGMMTITQETTDALRGTLSTDAWGGFATAADVAIFLRHMAERVCQEAEADD